MRDKFFLLVRLLCILTAISLAAEAQARTEACANPVTAVRLRGQETNSWRGMPVLSVGRAGR